MFYLEQCANERLSKRELDRQIDSALYERTKAGQPKLSPVMREIAPKAETVFRDQYVMEFISGKESKQTPLCLYVVYRIITPSC